MGVVQIQTILARLRTARIQEGLTTDALERALILGPGWVERFESGQSIPQLDISVLLAEACGTDLQSLVASTGTERTAAFRRALYAEPTDGGVRLSFTYGQYDASYDLVGASVDEVEQVLKILRDTLALLVRPSSDAVRIQTDAVAETFLRAVSLWPAVNPSDLWWFLVYRAYLDPFNHPAIHARLDLGQSWRRTAGWALEQVLVRHYEDSLARHGVRIFMAPTYQKQRLLPADLARRLEVDKVDVLLTGDLSGREVLFGVVHVKASFAERRTDDVPLSGILMADGYSSIFWTMDCKSTPGTHPMNRGELGAVLGKEPDVRSAKRRDFEEHGSFSACFSYNTRTSPTPTGQAVAARVYTVDFSNSDDDFTAFVVTE